MRGPEWLTEVKNWPSKFSTGNVLTTIGENEEDSETSSESKQIPNSVLNVIDVNRYSSFHKIMRIFAYVLRFISNCRSKGWEKLITDYLTPKEIYTATLNLVKAVQLQGYSEIFDCLASNSRHHLVRQLRLYLYSNGLIRCGGRINNAPLSDDAKFPYLLPKKHRFTSLLISDIYKQNQHCGIRATVTYLRQKFWIPSARQEVACVIRKCVSCTKVTGKAYRAPDPPPLPKDRLSSELPFTVTGVDFSGALQVKGENGQNCKVYICLFTCANTRAIHLEVVPDLTEESFLLAFRRFISRKSIPRTMISDNATTFIAAAEELRNLTESRTLHNKLSEYGTLWKFIPKRAPWYGGFWKRMVGLTKNCLKKVLGRSYINYALLKTIVVEIEANLKNRPLTYLSSDISDPEPLTPSHLLYGRQIKSFPYPDVNREESDCDNAFINYNVTLNEQTKRRFRLIEHFLTRWKHEYLTSLREFHRVSGNNIQRVKIGDVVQIHDDNLPRTKWKIGVIEELYYGNDNLVRSAKFRTSKSVMNRPIVKLYPLEICESDDTSRCERTAKLEAMDKIRKWTK